MGEGSDKLESEEDEEAAGNSDDDGSFASVNELDGMSSLSSNLKVLFSVAALFRGRQKSSTGAIKAHRKGPIILQVPRRKRQRTAEL
jgi:hypothetical protein